MDEQFWSGGYGIGDFDFSWDARDTPQKVDSRGRGYQVGADGIRGISLLCRKNMGIDLVKRIKDSQPFLLSEARFWGQQLAKLVPDFGGFDAVSAPPSSGKRADHEHLATIMAREVALASGLPYKKLFENTSPSGHRQSVHEKLRAGRSYIYTGDEEIKHAIMVDDVVFTRTTAIECARAAAGVDLFWLFLYR